MNEPIVDPFDVTWVWNEELQTYQTDAFLPRWGGTVYANEESIRSGMASRSWTSGRKGRS